jgi:DUF4097 and DUF4098 domain-containing protein YvlB
MKLAIFLLILGLCRPAVNISNSDFLPGQLVAGSIAENFQAQDEIRRSFPFRPGERVEFFRIQGDVTIITADVKGVEITVSRQARSPADLAQDTITFDNTPEHLLIQGRRSSAGDNQLQVNHQVVLTLPRRFDLSIDTVSGQLQVGDIDGRVSISSVGGRVNLSAVSAELRVANVSGAVNVSAVFSAAIKSVGASVRVNQVASDLNISNVSGDVQISEVKGRFDIGAVGGSVITGRLQGPTKINIVSRGVNIAETDGSTEIKSVGGSIVIGKARSSLAISIVTGALSVGIVDIAKSGLQIDRVSGPVELRFRSQPNAELITKNISGKLSIDLKNATLIDKSISASQRTRIGAGGPLITIETITSNVRLSTDWR